MKAIVLLLVIALAGCISDDQTLWGTPPVTPGDLNAQTPGGNDTSHETGASTPSVNGGQLLTPTGGQISQGTQDTPTGAANITILSADCNLRKVDYSVPSSEWDNPSAKATSPEYCLDITLTGTATGPVNSEMYVSWLSNDMPAFLSGGGDYKHAWLGGKLDWCLFPNDVITNTDSWSGTREDREYDFNTIREQGDPETTEWTFTNLIWINTDGGTVNKNTPITFTAIILPPDAEPISVDATFTCKF
jgi:hypothetical protein